MNRVRKPLTEAAKLKMREKAKINYRKKKEAKAKANLITRNEKDVVITSDLIQILKDIEIRKRIYGLRDLVYLTEQANLINKISETIKASNGEDVPKYKWCNYRGGNGAGKTLIGAAITVRLALGDLSKKLMLPVIGHKKNIWIGTASGKNVVETIGKYLLGEYSNTRIPPQFIKKARYDNGILKHLTLINGSQISILTYDQGYEKWQGGNPDFIWLDEDARDHRIWGEAIARTRTNQCNLLMTMTPLNGLTPAVEFFDEPNIEIAHKIHSVLVSSLDNIYTDKSWTKTLTPEEYKMRVEGLAIPPTGIVYNQFSPRENVIEHFNPKELGDPIKYYAAMDFGVNHPTAILFFAVDYDGRVYVYDEIYEKNALLQDLKKKYDEKKGDTHIEYVVADSASARERLELAATGLHTIKADKWSKGENEMSNRKAGILKVNQMLFNKELIVSDRCTNLIKEFRTHFYKDKGRDGTVEKEKDDALDALRYFIFAHIKPKSQTKERKRVNKIKDRYIKNNLISHNEPY